MTLIKILTVSTVILLAAACEGIKIEPLPKSEIPEIATPNI